MDTYDKDLCRERHETINRRFDKGEQSDAKAHERIDDLVTAINGKFTKLFYFFLATLVSSVGGLVGIIVVLARG